MKKRTKNKIKFGIGLILSFAGLHLCTKRYHNSKTKIVDRNSKDNPEIFPVYEGRVKIEAIGSDSMISTTSNRPIIGTTMSEPSSIIKNITLEGCTDAYLDRGDEMLFSRVVELNGRLAFIAGCKGHREYFKAIAFSKEDFNAVKE